MNDRDKKERVIQRNKRGGECTVRKSKEEVKEGEEGSVREEGAGVCMNRERE